MAFLWLLLSAILITLPSLSAASTESKQSTYSIRCSDGTSLSCELQDLKRKVAQLESVLQESIQNLNMKSIFLDHREELIQETTKKYHFLHSILSNINDESLVADKRIGSLEEEVRFLWASSRKNNFDIHVLKLKVNDAKEALDVLNSKVEKMSDIVSEQWIQIQHLQQALQITEMRTLEAQRSVGSSKCTFLKLVNSLYEDYLKIVPRLFDQYLSCQGATSSSYASQTLHQLKHMFSNLKKYHHELQDAIMKGMERNEVTITLANRELVFFMASAVVVFPVMAAWLWLSPWLC